MDFRQRFFVAQWRHWWRQQTVRHHRSPNEYHQQRYLYAQAAFSYEAGIDVEGCRVIDPPFTARGQHYNMLFQRRIRIPGRTARFTFCSFGTTNSGAIASESALHAIRCIRGSPNWRPPSGARSEARVALIENETLGEMLSDAKSGGGKEAILRLYYQAASTTSG